MPNLPSFSILQFSRSISGKAGPRKGQSNNRPSYEALEPRQLLAAAPIITEFVASNQDSLVDGNGATPDWIEIYNNGDQSVDLTNYALTDDPNDLGQWEFPSRTLEAGEYLVVFASGDAVPDLAGNLHTNFSLAAGGEYLALSDPSGVILSEFGLSTIDYPALQADEAYGLAFDSTVSEVVTPTSSAKYFIPGTDDSVDAIWTNNIFDDSAWTSGSASLGYEANPADYGDLIVTSLPVGTKSAYVRISFDLTNANTFLDTLQMRYDDGFIAYLNGTRIASGNAPAIVDHDSTSDGERPDSVAREYADFDVSAFSSELVVGSNTLAIHMLNKNSGSSDLLAVPNLIVTEGGLIEPVVEGRMLEPTPRRTNTNLHASDVKFARAGGTFSVPFLVTITSDGTNETIRYTTDGSLPTENSLLYTGPIAVNSTTQIHARAFGSIGQEGTAFAETYTFADSTVNSFTSDLPIIVIENQGQGVPDADFEDASLALYEVDEITGRSSLAGPADVTSVIGQHRRGSSTFNNPKPNLRIELRDTAGDDQAQSLLGLASESDWILYAPYSHDRAMVRDTLMHELSHQMGQYAVKYRFVEVYANTDDATLDSSDYLGVYVLLENIKIDDGRVDIASLDEADNAEPDITGGYILKIDRGGGFETTRGVPNRGGANFVHVDPEQADLTSEQTDYIRGYVQDLEDALYGPNATDPDLGYEAYLDVDASIDHHILRTLSLEPDSLGLSTYLTKDRNGKLSFGPVWDFDRALGSTGNDSRSADPEVWFSGVDFFEFDWWGELFNDPNFKQRWVDRWQELRTGVFSDTNVLSTLFSQTSQLEDSQVRNTARWPAVSLNGGPYAESGLSGWEAEVSHLEGWLMARLAWIDAQLVSNVDLGVSPGSVTAGSQVTLSSNQSGSDIYYTLDGSDPRADGGGVSSTATLYTGPITVNASTTITARAMDTPVDTVGRTPGSSPWSGVVSGLYSVGVVPALQSELRISEIHFNPADPTPAEISAGFSDNDDFEFLELINRSTTGTINFSGAQLSNGVTFDFGDTDLLPGERAVVVEDIDAFMARYGNSATILGEWSGALSNGGEQVTLLDSNSNEIMSVNYGDNDPWYNPADGQGFSMVLDDAVNTQANELGKYYSWRSSTELGGTPGEASADPSGVVINEILAHTDFPQSDSIELFNSSGLAIDVGGWYLSDQSSDLLKFQIPAGTIIDAGGYLVFDESDFNPNTNGFALSGSEGDQVYLSQAAGETFIGLQDSVQFNATFNGESVGRLPNGTGRLTRLASNSFGNANGAAEVGPLVISEINYHSENPSSAALAIDSTLTDNDLEYVEIANPTSSSIDLTNWRLRGESDYDFAAGTLLAAGEAIVVVSFDPSDSFNLFKLAAFREHYGISAGVTIVGGLSASFSNSTGRIALQQPDTPDLLGLIPHVVVDEAVYDDLSPWGDADGSGQVLERDDLSANGNLAGSWIAVAPTPGLFEDEFLLGDVNLDGAIDFSDIHLARRRLP